MKDASYIKLALAIGVGIGLVAPLFDVIVALVDAVLHYAYYMLVAQAPAPSTAVDTVVTIGGVSDTFTSTTEA